MTQLPSGTVTFLFTDIEGSTRLWQEHPDTMPGVLARHDQLLRESVDEHGGYVVKTTGDGIHAAFADPHGAVEATVAAQRAIANEPWPLPQPLRIRAGLHSGLAEERDGDYYGTAVNRAARLMSIAHGGQIVLSHATEALLDDDRVELRDLGEHRLRDLTRAERCYQVLVPELESDFPPLASLDPLRSNLPDQLTSFVGREREVDEIADALASNRLVTVTGVGGVGKTRLALQVAAYVAPRFGHGTWLCELAPATDGDALIQIVASTIGVAPRPGSTLEGSVVESLRPKTVLLVLDNCEHLLRSVGDLVESLLQECRHTRILATSREGLAVAGEQTYPLRALGIARESASPDELRSSEAVRLFAERATAARPSFTLDGANLDVVGEICRRLDGIPLAIELAAARVGSLNPAEIASLLDERFRLLAGGRRTAVERHRTLRATVDWSFSLLADREKRVFERLAVFAGGIDVTAAVSVIRDEEIDRFDVIDALGEVVAKSLVTIDEDAVEGTRYHMLETMRAYAAEILEESGSADAWRRRHAEHFAAFAEEIGPALCGPDELVRRSRFHQELDNLRTAVSWSLDRDDPRDPMLAIRTIAALANQSFLDRVTGIGSWATGAIAIAEDAPAGMRTAVLAAAGQDLLLSGRYHDGRALAGRALRDGLPPGCPTPHLAHMTVAECHTFSGDHLTALETIREAQAAVEQVGGDPFSMAVLRGAEASFTAMKGDFVEARPIAEDAVLLARSVGNPSALGNALFALGFACWRDDPDGALSALSESIALTRAGATDAVYGAALSLAARVLARTGHSSEALVTLRQAIEACHDIGDHPTLFSALDRGIDVLARAGEAEHAAILVGVVTLGPYRSSTSLQGGPEEELRAEIAASLEELIGPDEYGEAAARGAAMTYAEIIDWALATVDRSPEER